MRDFEARLEEIRRRSEALKKKERRRRKLWLAVIPTALCAAICLTALLPGWQRSQETHKDPGDAIADMEQAPEMHMDHYSATTSSVTAIQITGKGVDKHIDDPTVVARVCQLLETVTEPTPNFSMAGVPTGGAGEVYGDGRGQQGTTGKSQSKDHYIVAFLDADGVIREYRLNKSVLTALATGETDFLGEDDLAQLYGLLNLPVE